MNAKQRKNIEQLAKEIHGFLVSHEMWVDVHIYFNGKCWGTSNSNNTEFCYNQNEVGFMNDYIKQCVNSRVDFFDKYYTVPAELKPEVEAFINEINKLGDAATDAVDFENKFASSELSERFNSLLTRCIPKAYNMTNEEKQHSKETAKEIFKEDRSRIIKEAAEEAVEHATIMANEELIAKRRESMIEEGVFDEYTRASNAADIITESGSFLKNLFKKRK